MSRLVPARLLVRDDGTPYSDTYGDVYHSACGGLEQARQVFLAGNALPARWRDRERFCIVETGFGLGLNFLAAWAAWQQDPSRCERLHYVSVELHPFDKDDLLAALRRWPELAALATELVEHWPLLVPGFHRLHLDRGRVVLTLLFGNAADMLPQLDCRTDAFFLDGFSPARNPELWSPTLFAELARLATTGATLATWSVSGTVRRGLEAAGFSCRKVRGFAAKRQMLQARYETIREDIRVVPTGQRHAMVVGAGLAGSSVANRLAERGWRVDVIESAAGPGQGASGNHAGVLRPLPGLDDNRLARITRAAALYALRHLERLQENGATARWDMCGVLHLARDAAQEEKMREVVETHAYPDAYLQYVDRERAGEIARWPVAAGGWWFPHGGWVNPPSLCAANLAAWPDRIRVQYGKTVARLAASTDGWAALDDQGAAIGCAPIVILANGVGINAFPEAAALPVRSARGQVTHVSEEGISGPEVVVCRAGYVSPVIDGMRSVGATFTVDDPDCELRDGDQRENLAKLDSILPGRGVDVVLSEPRGRVGFRPASPDRLPMIGVVPTAAQVHPSTSLNSVSRNRGLYAVSGFGARGLVWAALAGELLASQLDAEPLPLERELVDAMDPARYLVRAKQRSGRSGKVERGTPPLAG